MSWIDSALRSWLCAVLVAWVSAGSGFAQDFEVCRNLLAEAASDRSVGECFFLEGKRLGLDDEAAAALEALAAEDPEATWFRHYRGRLVWWPDGTEILRDAAEDFSRQQETSGEILARTKLVTLYGFAADFSSASRELAVAQQLLIDSSSAEDRAAVLVAEAHFLMLAGNDLERALRRLDSAAGLLDDREHALEKLGILRSLLTASLDLGLDSRSKLYARSAKALADELGWLHYRVQASFNAIHQTLRTESPHEARRQRVVEELEALVEMAALDGYAEVEAKSLRLLGEMRGDADARNHFLRCRKLAREIRDTDVERRCLLSLASQQLGSDPVAARGLLDEAYRIGLEHPGPWTLFYGWEDRLRVLWETQPREQALEGASVVIGAIEALRRTQVGSGSERLLSAWADVYYWVAGRLLAEAVEEGPGEVADAAKVAKAFAVFERLRAQTLREVLEAPRADSSEVPVEWREAREAIDRELVAAYRHLLDPSLIAAERQQALVALSEVEKRESDLESRIFDSIGLAPAADPPAEDLLDRVSARLADDEALLTFQLGFRKGWDRRFLGDAWVLATTSSGTRVYRLASDRAEIEPRLRIFLGLSEPGGEAANRLYRDLVAAPLAQLPDSVRKLVIVPDGRLHLLPFSVLPTVDAEPLIARFDLEFAPSADLWLRWRESTERTVAGVPERSASALVLASPTLPSSREVSQLRSGGLSTAADLGPLPYARREGRRVTRHFGGGSRLVAAETASEAFLKSTPLEAYGVLHFAAHALVDAERPARSAVMLAAGDEEQDGLLRPAEIAALRGLEGKLVVLSSCNSASGGVLRGEGVMSLARAFFEAGAQAVVGSLWRLDDRLAAEFFDDLYRRLAAGDSVRSAVSETQREWMEAGRPASTWAGIVVLGNGELVPVPGGVARAAGRLVWLAFALALALAGLLLFSLSSRRGTA